MSVYFTQKVIARAKDTGVESNKITGKEGKTLCWEKQGWAMEDAGLEGWIEMVGRMFCDQVGKQGFVFSFDLCTECPMSGWRKGGSGAGRQRGRRGESKQADPRDMGPEPGFLRIKSRQSLSYFCPHSCMRK